MTTPTRPQALSGRLAVIEQMVPQAAQPTPPAPSYPYRYQQLEDWVDEVFARLAAAHRAKWCTNWADHAEAKIRLEVLWHTWEAAMAAAPDTDPQWAAVDEWLRVRLDHHVDKLLDVDGPFAGCIPARGIDPGRCSAPRPLAQRPLLVGAHRRRRQPGCGRPPGGPPPRCPPATRRSPIMSYPQARFGCAHAATYPCTQHRRGRPQHRGVAHMSRGTR